jgi:predicted outer membrane repeat protein
MLASLLSNNTAEKSGAALYAGENSSVVVKECTVANNTAVTLDGGGIFTQENSMMFVANSVFTSNRARAGGAFYSLNSSMPSNIASVSGGAMSGENAACIMDACTFDKNIAGYGGAIRIQDATHVWLHRCVIYNNSATNYGGGVHVGGNSSNVTMSSCRLVNNIAKQDGGALLITGLANVFMVGETEGVGNSGDSGGFASLDTNARLEVTGGMFEGNFANGRGGVITAHDRTALVLTSCHILGKINQPEVYGGAFNLDGNTTLKMVSCAMSDFHVQRGGGIAAFGNSSFHARNSTISNCSAVQSGGGVYTFGGRHTWLGGIFSGMHASEGASMYIMAGSVDVANVVFMNGTSLEGGGALFVGGTSHVSLNACNIQGCTTTSQRAGAIYVKGNATVSLDRCNVSECHTNGGGGALAGAANGTIMLQNCRLQRNTGNRCGGATHVEGTSRLVATSCLIVENSCKNQGGAICALEDASFLWHECVVLRNSGSIGGAIWLEGNASMGLHSTRVEENTAKSYGGGVILGSSRFSVSELRASVRNNMAPFGKDVIASPINISNTNASTIQGFVSRLGSDVGLLNVTLRISGAQGLPAERSTVHAILDGVIVAKASSREDGLVNMRVKLRKPPGEWLHDIAYARVVVIACVCARA